MVDSRRLEALLLRTPRLLIVPARKGDFPALIGLWRELYGTIARRRMLSFVQKRQASYRLLLWTVRLNTTGAFVGACELNRIDMGAGRADIGCALKKSRRKQGYMYEALGAVVRHGFGHCGLVVLGADIAKDNCSSLSLFEKLGFAPAGQDASPWTPGGALRFILPNRKRL